MKYKHSDLKGNRKSISIIIINIIVGLYIKEIEK
jgi:hypothetical protein